MRSTIERYGDIYVTKCQIFLSRHRSYPLYLSYTPKEVEVSPPCPIGLGGTSAYMQYWLILSACSSEPLLLMPSRRRSRFCVKDAQHRRRRLVLDAWSLNGSGITSAMRYPSAWHDLPCSLVSWKRIRRHDRFAVMPSEYPPKADATLRTVGECERVKYVRVKLR